MPGIPLTRQSRVADGTFDPVAGEVVARELRRIEDELFAADWAEAKARLGGEVHRCQPSRNSLAEPFSRHVIP
jgi:hypothetical protein